MPGMRKEATPIERKLLKMMGARGQKVSIELASKVLGKKYPAGFATLNDLISARKEFFNKTLIPLRNDHRRIVNSAIPLSKVTPNGKPIFRGDTRLNEAGVTYRNAVKFPESLRGELPSEKVSWLERLSGRRYYSAYPEVAYHYATGPQGTRWLRIANLDTPVGRWATKHNIVVGTPHIDIPSHKFRKVVRQMIDKGKLDPSIDLINNGKPLQGIDARLNNELTVPAWLRPFIGEKRYLIVNHNPTEPKVVSEALGKRLESIQDAILSLRKQKMQKTLGFPARELQRY